MTDAQKAQVLKIRSEKIYFHEMYVDDENKLVLAFTDYNAKHIKIETELINLTECESEKEF